MPLKDWYAAGFDWDSGNKTKIRDKHRVTMAECEEVLRIPGLPVFHDTQHSNNEDRHYSIGRTKSGRRLFIVFTRREDRIRVITARDMHARELKRYAPLEKDSEI